MMLSGASKRNREERADAGRPSPAQAAFVANTALLTVTVEDGTTFLVRHVPDVSVALGADHWPTLTLPGQGAMRVLCVLFRGDELLLLSATEDGQELGCFTSDALPEATALQLLTAAADPPIEELFSANFDVRLEGGFPAESVPELAGHLHMLAEDRFRNENEWLSGGCHCGAVSFLVQVPSGPLCVQDCNCSICTKKGFLHLIVPAAAFRLLSPKSQSELGLYAFGTGVAKHLFCKGCGICSFYVPR